MTERVITDSRAVNDVFLDKFDITWAADNAHNISKTLTIIPVETANHNQNTQDDGTITYFYNNEWFRSDDFSATHNSKYHVLFAGCSETEGVGGNIDTVWTKMLHASLKEKYDIDGFYSIAKAGFGWQKIITNFTIYVKKYGAPTHLFVLMPNIDRQFAWYSSEKKWRYIQKFPFSAGSPSNADDFQNIATEEEHMKMLADFTVGWKLFIEYCNSIGTKILWSTWDFEESPNFLLFDQPGNFFVIKMKEAFGDFIRKNRPDGKLNSDDLDRRDGHSGVLFHMYWKEKFMEEIEKRGMFSD